MKTQLRAVFRASLPFAAALAMGLASSIAHAEARQVGGNKATWDKACQKSKDCMPVGDVGNGVNGYFVHDGNGGGASVWCTDTKCVADRGTSPKTAAQDMQQHPAALSGSASQPAPALTGNETPAALLKLR